MYIHIYIKFYLATYSSKKKMLLTKDQHGTELLNSNNGDVKAMNL